MKRSLHRRTPLTRGPLLGTAARLAPARVVLLGTMLAIGCLGKSHGTPSGRADLGVLMEAGTPGTGTPVKGGPVDTVVVTISGPGISPVIVQNLSNSSQGWETVIGAIPAGTNRIFHVDASAMGTVVFAGTAPPVTIVDGQTAIVQMLLQQVTPPAPLVIAAPVITSVTASSDAVAPNDTVSLAASASDSNATDAIAYAWTADSGSFTNGATSSAAWLAPATEGTSTITLSVTDVQNGLVSSISFTISVLAADGHGGAAISVAFNNPPTVSTILASPAALDFGGNSALDVTASDLNGDVIQYAFGDNCGGSFLKGEVANQPNWVAPSSPGESFTGTCTITVTVSDGRGGTSSGSLTLPVGTPPAFNVAPTITVATASVPTANVHGTVTLAVTAADAQNSVLSFAWSTTSNGHFGSQSDTPEGTPTDSTNTFTVDAYDPEYDATVTVTNAAGNATTFTFVIASNPCNGPSPPFQLCGGS